MIQAPKVLLLDLMGTLVREPFYRDVPSFFDMSLSELLAVKSPTAWIEFENGQIDEATFLDRFFEDGRVYDQQGLVRMMRAAYEYLPGAEQLLADLNSAGVRMNILSNYPSWYAMIDEKLAFSRFFESIFVSCDLGCRKPDRAPYEAVIEALALEPHEILFVDDRPENCTGAERVGMQSLHFADVPGLRAELTRRGVLRSDLTAS